MLATYDATVVREAVQAELERDGQVFYVVPKIGMMEEANKRLKSLFPNLRVMQAHGQMKGEQLDSAMDEFASGHADVLLCTTIVESGLDIPNVNTIIIEEVQQFGLASLYQLRGRVGRAGRQAYAYMFHAEMGDLREEAQERLLALEECCGLGEGFKLAERDMAIRGVGTIFGDKQSGEVDSIGADLYLELLYNQLEKIEKLRLNPVAPQDVRTPGRTSTPMLGGEYVATGDARVVANESLANARSIGEMEKVLESLTACFGDEVGRAHGDHDQLPPHARACRRARRDARHYGQRQRHGPVRGGCRCGGAGDAGGQPRRHLPQGPDGGGRGHTRWSRSPAPGRR